jgi:hypothetical protein
MKTQAEDMNTEPSVKLIKKEKRKVPEIPPRVQAASGPNKWSTAVQLWISEFQKRRDESLPGFDSLFK